MRSLTLGYLLETQFLAFWLTHPLVTVCIKDLVIDLAKSPLVLVSSIGNLPAWALSLLWQPSLRAFPWQSFVMSFSYQSQPFCTLVGLENPFLTPIRVASVHDWPTLMSVTKVQSFVGFVNFYWWFIQDYRMWPSPCTSSPRKERPGSGLRPNKRLCNTQVAPEEVISDQGMQFVLNFTWSLSQL